MEDPKVTPIDIDRLEALPIGRAKINGNIHPVLQPKGRVIQSVRTADTSNSTERLYAAVAACVPTLPEDEVADLTINQLTALWGVACGGIEAAQAMFPNVYGPDATSTSPA